MRAGAGGRQRVGASLRWQLLAALRPSGLCLRRPGCARPSACPRVFAWGGRVCICVGAGPSSCPSRARGCGGPASAQNPPALGLLNR